MRLRRMTDDLKRSAVELKNVRSLTAVSMLLAIQIILGLFTIPVSNSIHITFDYVPLCLTSILFGPVPAMLTGALSDLIVFLIKPTGPFNPGFTLSAALSGLIYSLFLYRSENAGIGKFALARLSVVLICNICLNSCLLIALYGQGAFAWIPGRILKNAIEYPVSLLLLCSLTRILPASSAGQSGKQPPA